MDDKKELNADTEMNIIEQPITRIKNDSQNTDSTQKSTNCGTKKKIPFKKIPTKDDESQNLPIGKVTEKQQSLELTSTDVVIPNEVNDTGIAVRHLEDTRLTKGKCGYINRNNDPCDTQGHVASDHLIEDFEKRHDLIVKIGYEPFQEWFLEFEFRNWWQLNGRNGVPLYKIYGSSNGEIRKWKSLYTHAPNRTPDVFHPPQKQPTKPKKPPAIPLKPTKFSDFMKVELNPSMRTSDPEINLQWCQNDKLILIDIEMSDVPRDKVSLIWDEDSFRVEVEQKPTELYFLQIELAHKIMHNFNVYKVLPKSLVFTFKKRVRNEAGENGEWKSLCKDPYSRNDRKMKII